jgi:ABC-type arginine transport system ATPase subunit
VKICKGFRGGELVVFTGPTGAGKTTLLSQLSLDFAKEVSELLADRKVFAFICTTLGCSSRIPDQIILLTGYRMIGCADSLGIV